MSSKTKTNKASDNRPARARYTAADQRNKNKDRRVVRDSKRKRVHSHPGFVSGASPEVRKAVWKSYRESTPHAEPLTLREAGQVRAEDRARESNRSLTPTERDVQRMRNASRHPHVIQSAR